MLVSTTKGIEAESFMLMSQILEQIAPQARIGVLSGPNLAREVAEHALTATVVASQDEALCRHVQKVLHGRTSCICQLRTVSVSSWAGAEECLRDHGGHGGGAGHGENTRSMLITRALAEMTRFAVKPAPTP